jgi:cytoplasmic iron level regulating protein YaaA (DUF328/UPF0246 family)
LEYLKKGEHIMLLLLSPAKTLDFSGVGRLEGLTQPRFEQQTEDLVAVLKGMSAEELSRLMDISAKLASENVGRYKDFVKQVEKACIRAFKGDVYVGLQASGFDEGDMAFAQASVRILSGLYGLLRPLDGIRPYRLEMGTQMSVGGNKNLYTYWGDRVTKLIDSDVVEYGHKAIINLASEEYFGVVKPSLLSVPIYKMTFKDGLAKGDLKVISFFAKKARGMMTRFAIKNRLCEVGDLRQFEEGGYGYDETLSTEFEYVFVR